MNFKETRTLRFQSEKVKKHMLLLPDIKSEISTCLVNFNN
jgi:hypothetical protein